MDMETPLKDARLIDSKPVQGDLNLPEGRIIAPGDPSRSVLLYRMTTGGRGHMPYLGGKLIDDKGVLLMRDWIASQKPSESISDAVKQQRAAEQESLKRLAAGEGARLDDLLATSSGTLSVALAVIDGTLRGDARQQAIAKGSALSDPLRRDLFERFLPESQRRKVLGPDIQPASILSVKGDATKGKALFSAICAACHHAADTGIDFGPDLTHIASKYDRAGVLDQILHPAKVIEPQWELATISLKSGDALSGFVTERTAHHP
jgi:mono/diheme cytochrome c family protein